MFKPKRVLIEKDALSYPIGRSLEEMFRLEGTNIIMLDTTRTKGIPGKDKQEKYKEGKDTLVIGVRKSLDFATCKPSAHYQLPLVTGCIGQCEYCYLNTQLGDKPYTRVFVNIEEILRRAKKYIDEREGITIFEGAATSDPLPVEPYTHALADTIEFFAKEEKGRFRFVTKYNDIDSLLTLGHNNHTTIRFSINTDDVIKHYEHRTPSMMKRIEAASKVIEAGYPTGFIIAPVFLYDHWERDYELLLQVLAKEIHESKTLDLTFEVISHRYTHKAKNRIMEVFPDTTLPMDDGERKFKYGQFGYGKYVYDKESLEDMRLYFEGKIKRYFPQSTIKYII